MHKVDCYCIIILVHCLHSLILKNLMKSLDFFIWNLVRLFYDRHCSMPRICIAPYIASWSYWNWTNHIFIYSKFGSNLIFDSHLGQNSCLFSLNLCEITCMILRARNGPIASLVNIDKQTRVKARGDRLSHLFIVLAWRTGSG